MNEITLATTASQINHEHSLAIKHADQAIGHAKRAGEFLLEAKKQLPHGEFGAWLEANVAVTQRQAQRYMAAALGKPTPIRAIVKNDTVSHLPTQSLTYADGFVSSTVADITASLINRVAMLKIEIETLKARNESYRAEGEEMKIQFERNRHWITKLEKAA